MVGPAGRLGDLAQRRLVDRDGNLLAADVEGAVRGAVGDRVHRYPGAERGIAGLGIRASPLGFTVGEQHDGRRRRRLAVCGDLVAERADGLQTGEDALTDRGGRTQLQAADAGADRFAVGGRRDENSRGARERHQAQVDPWWQLIHERLGALFGRLEPVGGDVDGRHRVRDVDRQHDGRAFAGYPFRARRAGEGEHHGGQREQQDNSRHMAAPPLWAPRQHGREQSRRGEPGRIDTPAHRQQDVGHCQGGDHQQQPQPVAGEEAHRGVPAGWEVTRGRLPAPRLRRVVRTKRTMSASQSVSVRSTRWAAPARRSAAATSRRCVAAARA